MIIKIMPNKIQEQWDRLVPGLREAISSKVWSSDATFNSLLAAVLSNRMFVYIGLDEDDPKNVFPAFAMFVNIIVDEPSMCRVLQVYAFFDLTEMRPSDRVLSEAFEVLFTLGRDNGCGKLITITNCSRILDICDQFGGTKSTMLAFDIPTRVVGRTIREAVSANGNG